MSLIKIKIEKIKSSNLKGAPNNKRQKIVFYIFEIKIIFTLHYLKIVKVVTKIYRDLLMKYKAKIKSMMLL